MHIETNEIKLPASAGLMAVIKELNLKTLLPAIRSTVVSGARKTNNVGGIINEYYPKSYAVEGLYANLKIF